MKTRESDTSTSSVSSSLSSDTMVRPGKSRRLGGLFPGLGQLLPPLVVGIVLFAILEIAFRLEIVSDIILPSPFAIAAEAWDQAFNGFMWDHMWVTTQEALIGFLIASVAGIGFGVAIGLSQWMARAIYPYLVLVQSMPRIALVPIFIAIFGFGMSTKIVTAVVLAFFPPVINTIVGLREVDQDSVTLMRSLSASRIQIFRKLLWPSALPSIFGGVKTALTLAFLGAFVAELTAANEGVGVLMESAAYELRMESLFAYLIWFSLISLFCFGVLEIVDRKVVFWKREARRSVFGVEETA